MPQASEGSNVFTANVVEVGEDYVEFEASWVSSSTAFQFERYIKIRIPGAGTFTFESEEIGGANSTFYAYIDGLSPGTEYTWKATLGWGDANGGQTYSTWAVVEGSFLTDQSIVIDLWSWDSSNGSATASQTKTAYDILMGTVSLDEGFSHKVWNDFVDKVMEMRSYKDDGTWDIVGGDYLSYEECKVSAGDTLSADIYNATKLQIGQVVGTWADVSPEDALYGWHIINLAEKLNEAIIELSG